MKTRILPVLFIAAALCLVAGCIVSSVYPYYTPKDLTYDRHLEGTWCKGLATNETWSFGGRNGQFYILTTVDSQSTNNFEAHLFKLKQYEFLDLLTTNRDEFQMPVHILSRVTLEGAGLTLHFLDYGWVTGLLETNPAVLRHVILPAEAGNTNDNMVFLTADTKELQKFLLKHIADTNAFSKDATMELRRQP